MKILRIRNLLAIFFAAVILGCVSAFVKLPTANADVNYAPVNSVAQAGFYSVDGAEIRLLSSGHGIRFSTVIEEGFYDYLTKTYEGAGFEFHTLVNYTGAEITSITPDTAKTDNVTVSKTVDKSAFEDGIFKYYASVIYNGDSAEGVTEETLRKAYSCELTARGYVQITRTGSDPIIIYAAANDTVRSARGVASVAELNETDEYKLAFIRDYMVAADKTINDVDNNIGGYYGERYNGDAENYNPSAYAKSGAVEITGLSLDSAAKVDEAFLNSKKVAVTAVSDGKMSISGYEFDESEIDSNGSDAVLTVYGADGNAYRQTVKLVTKIITVKEDMSGFQWKSGSDDDAYSGYYVLGNDVSLSGYTPAAHANLGNAPKGGLTGTFDGQGYSLTDFTYSTSSGSFYGFFGAINGGTIKNLAVKNAIMTGASRFSLFSYFVVGLNMENVYAEVSLNGNGNYLGGMFYQIGNSDASTIKNTVFKVDSTGTSVYYRGSLCGDVSINFDTQKWSDVYMISELALAKNFNTGVVKDASNRDGNIVNISRYDTLSAMESPNNYQNFSTDYWKVFEGVVYWHDTKIIKEVSGVFNYSQQAKALEISSESEIYDYEQIESETAGYTATVTDQGLIIEKNGEDDFTATGEEIKLLAKKGDIYYRFIAKICTMFIDEASDLAVFQMTSENTAFPGYYMLTTNIDASSYTHAAHTGLAQTFNASFGASAGLTGTFDGNGYTISNLSFEKGDGLFGNVGPGGTVKNVAFKNAVTTAVDGGKYPSLIAAYVVGATIENVYADISMANGRAWNGALFYQAASQNTTIKNCLIVADVKTGTHYGSLAAEATSRMYLRCTDLYVISDKVLVCNNGTVTLDASNCTGQQNTMEGAYRYDTQANMDNDETKNLSSFDTTYWNVENGVLTFKEKA